MPTLEQPRQQTPESSSEAGVAFGEKLITKATMKELSQELRHWREDGSPKAAFETARTLAHLKRSGVKLNERGREANFAFLEENRQHMRDIGPRALAQYLSYMKYLGAVEELDVKEQALINQAIAERSKHSVPADEEDGLSALVMNAKYLGVIEQPHWMTEKSLQKRFEHVAEFGNGAVMVQEAARLQQVGVNVDVTDDMQSLATMTAENLRDNGDLGELAKMRLHAELGPAALERAVDFSSDDGQQAASKLHDSLGVLYPEWPQYVAQVGDLRAVEHQEISMMNVDDEDITEHWMDEELVEAEKQEEETLGEDQAPSSAAAMAEASTVVSPEIPERTDREIVDILQSHRPDGTPDSELLLWDLEDEVKEAIRKSSSYEDFVAQQPELLTVLSNLSLDPQRVWGLLRPPSTEPSPTPELPQASENVEVITEEELADRLNVLSEVILPSSDTLRRVLNYDFRVKSEGDQSAFIKLVSEKKDVVKALKDIGTSPEEVYWLLKAEEESGR